MSRVWWLVTATSSLGEHAQCCASGGSPPPAKSTAVCQKVRDGERPPGGPGDHPLPAKTQGPSATTVAFGQAADSPGMQTRLTKPVWP